MTTTREGVGLVCGWATGSGRRGTTMGVGLGFDCAAARVVRRVCAPTVANTQSATVPSIDRIRNLLAASGKRSTLSKPSMMKKIRSQE
jgi:hypothetical protein